MKIEDCELLLSIMTYKDKALEELFLAQKPHFNDNDAFMASLTKRLDAVEYIKQYQEVVEQYL